MIRSNPYASSRRTAAAASHGSSGQSSCQKRPQRPWENSGKTTTTPPEEEPKLAATSSESSSDPFDDDGFDWSAAVESVDAAVCMSEQSVASELTSRAGKENVANSQPSQPVASLQGTLTTNSVVSSGPPAEVGLHRKTAVTSVAPSHSTLASLRPESWQTKKVAGRAPPNTYTSPSYPNGDVRQDGLPRSLQFDPKLCQAVEDDLTKTLLAHARLASPLNNGWKLFPHQINALKQSLAMRRFILALDMGLGKTVIGCVWARSFLQSSLLQCKRVLVVCPVSLQKEWKRTAEDYVGVSTADPEKKPSLQRQKKRASSISDEEEEKDPKPSVPPVSIHSWAKVPGIPEQGNFVVVADEAHNMQSMQSARTCTMLELVLHERCIGVLLLTGTPMKNGKPANLFPLLKAVRHPLGRNQRDFETRFCNGRQIRFGKTGRSAWQANGSANLDQLRALAQSHMLHLTKEECLPELPPQTRVFEEIPVSSSRQLQHNQALQELARIYKTSNSKEGPSKEVVGAVQKVRAIGSRAKVDAAVQYAKKILEEEPAVVIFTSFVEVATEVHRKLEGDGWCGALLTGETPANKRQCLVDQFQEGILSTFVCTFGVAGVGLTLTAAHTVILLDRPWTPGEVFQAEDRVRRIGQTHPVRSIWIRAFEIDKQIDNMIAHKNKTSAAVLKADAESTFSPSSSQERISIAKLLDAIMPAACTNNTTQTSILQFSQQSTKSCETQE